MKQWYALHVFLYSYYHTIPYYTRTYHTIPYHNISYHSASHHTIPYHISYHTCNMINVIFPSIKPVSKWLWSIRKPSWRHNYTSRTTKLLGGYIGFTPSVRPSVPRPSRIPCPLCSFYSSGWIRFIFIHLIKQLQKVCRVQNFLKFCQFF